jgi:hypothetical protein
METQVKQQIEEINKKQVKQASKERMLQEKEAKANEFEAKLKEQHQNQSKREIEIQEVESTQRKSEKMLNLRKVQLYQNLDKFN